MPSYFAIISFITIIFHNLISLKANEENNDIQICGGFIEIDLSENQNLKQELDLSSIVVSLYTTDMILKEQSNVAQSGYYFLPVDENSSLIIKISGPNGISFEPEQYVFNVNDVTTIEDYCKIDNNFKFIGYYLEGQISTFGTYEGPEGIEISLFKKGDKEDIKIQDTITVESGAFKFNPVYPGKYILKPTHEKDIERFDSKHNQLVFEVKANKKNYLEKALIVKGYQVSGTVIADNQPTEGILGLIYSFNSTLTHAYECEYFKENPAQKQLILSQKVDNLVPFCAAVSDKNGEFYFYNIPFGSFLVMPYFHDENVAYEILPKTSKVEVEHKNVILSTPFNVKTFSIKGKVVSSKGKGVANVSIKVDGLDKAVSDKDGIYILENIVSGNYDLEATTDDMYFEPIQNLKITTQTKSLPNFIVKDYKLCGKIHIEANDNISSVKRAVLLKEKETNSERRRVTDIHGKYCFEVKPSTYHIQPLLSQEEKDAELHLTPESIDVEIVDEPRLDIDFYQSKVEISGFVTCLNDCQSDMKVFLTSLKKSEKVISVNLEKVENKKEYKFKFNNILSGQYKLSIQKFEWCWDQEEILIKVQNQKIENLSFKQIGYSLF